MKPPRKCLHTAPQEYACMRRKALPVTSGIVLAVVTVLWCAASESAAQEDLAKRQAYLEQLRRIIPESPEWEAWLAETGELPPDFSAMPSVPHLPDPLLREVNGRQERVTTPEAWRERREELKALLHHWVIGTAPPPPENLRAEVLSEREEAGATVREVQLAFGPDHKAKLWLEIFIPKGVGPFPVFMTQYNHRAWVLIAVRRGYLCCVYAGADARDDTHTFIEAYSGYDWSKLTRRAWAAGRCLDYLETVPEADTKRVVLTGHSRNGKQSLIASALDERFSVVISSSSGAGGCLTTRYFAEQHFGEGIESITRRFPDWFHPRFRFFVGREDKLPVDLHELVALSAPRPCLLSIALNDNVESSWAMQQTYLSVQQVYRLLGAEDHLRILWRPAAHETWPTIIERYLDWCDTHFGRRDYEFPEHLIHPWNWDEWKRRSGLPWDAAQFPRRALDDRMQVSSEADWLKEREEIRAAVQEMLGTPPPVVSNPMDTYGREAAHIRSLLKREGVGEGLERDNVVFGEYVNGDVYMPEGLRESGRKAPAILWLHPFSYSHGYVAGYKRGEYHHRTLARAGYAVFCFDQVGFGRRIEEVEGFYERYPDWSLLGKMVRDAQAALDAIEVLPYIDQDNVWVVGYSLGALVGLHLAALDERVDGLVSICGPQPFRLDTVEKGAGGLRRWSQDHMLLPRLGLFIGHEDRVPYDVPELLACIAPRPVLVVSPQLDREARLEDVTRAVEAARKVYALRGAADGLVQLSPEDYNTFEPPITQDAVIGWLGGHKR